VVFCSVVVRTSGLWRDREFFLPDIVRVKQRLKKRSSGGAVRNKNVNSSGEGGETISGLYLSRFATAKTKRMKELKKSRVLKAEGFTLNLRYGKVRGED